jgi:Domain of unknown function (DU1801)
MMGYGPFHYRYASGRQGDTAHIALASTKAGFSLYVLVTIDGKYLAETQGPTIGKVSVGKSCIRFKKCSDIDDKKLIALLKLAAKHPPTGAE